MAAAAIIIRDDIKYLVYDKSIEVTSADSAVMIFFARKANHTTDVNALHSLVMMGKNLKTIQIKKVLELID
jgi:hypothetical protein